MSLIESQVNSYGDDSVLVNAGETYTGMFSVPEAYGGEAVINDLIWNGGRVEANSILLSQGGKPSSYLQKFTVVSGVVRVWKRKNNSHNIV